VVVRLWKSEVLYTYMGPGIYVPCPVP